MKKVLVFIFQVVGFEPRTADERNHYAMPSLPCSDTLKSLTKEQGAGLCILFVIHA